MVLKIKDNKLCKKELQCLLDRIGYDPYFEMMLMALAKVSKDYITYGENDLHTEGTFVSEFYRHWCNLIGDNNPDNLFLNNVPSKYLLDKNVQCRKEPDLILHRSQGNCDDNRIACEVKRASWASENVIKDMHTLNLLLTAENEQSLFRKNFKYGVFIQGGGNISKLKNLANRDGNDFNDNILCVVINDEVNTITIDTIKELKNR